MSTIAMAPKAKRTSPTSSPVRRGGNASPTRRGGDIGLRRDGNSSPASPPLIDDMVTRSELNLPIDPNVERGYLQAILIRFDLTSLHDEDVPPPEGYTSWQDVPEGLSSYCSGPEELDILRAELPLDEGNAEPHDLTEPLKQVEAKIAQASNAIGKIVYYEGRYGKVEGIKMGKNTMQFYYTVRFSPVGKAGYLGDEIMHFQNFELEKIIRNDLGFDPFSKTRPDIWAKDAPKKAGRPPAKAAPMKAAPMKAAPMKAAPKKSAMKATAKRAPMKAPMKSAMKKAGRR